MLAPCTCPDVIEAALKTYGGRAIVNSINMENGRSKIEAVLPVVKEHGAAVVAMTIDDPGTFNQPWQAISRLRRVAPQDIAVLVPGTLTELVCAENNQVLFDYGIPVADKPDF